MTINCHYCGAAEAYQAKNILDVMSKNIDTKLNYEKLQFQVLDYAEDKFLFICWSCIHKRGEKPSA